ncbi:lipopolysaccharide biosynthesis protein (plasmid) [Ensifer adhaerens]|uniref:lipopolysaccharide biosynthesis protein n=1 Tax=Ensifer adhaerens TaxID=106592 RepID=UPI0023A928FE|nr:lipopolysaccharide biosynthesis protein [Ensifer adhaerens]WDZ80818.1 lipopolysaccharide biosynthesis protein [Ensifer adhaerens]
MSNIRQGLAKRSVVGMFWTGLSMGALALAEAAALLVLARLLSPNEFGLYAAALVIIKLATIFENLGVAPAIVQRPELDERHLRVGFTLSLILSLLIAGLVWVIAPAIAHAMRLAELAPVVRATSVVFLCQGVALVAQAVAQRSLRFEWLAAVDAATFAVGFVIAAPVFALAGFGIWALVGALMTQNLLRTIVLLIGQPHPKRLLLERRAIGELLYFGGGFTVARVCNYLATQVDKLIVGRTLGAGALGIYSLASQLMTTPAVIIGQILDRVLFPTMALVQQEPARLARAYRSAVAACALVVLPASVVVAITAPELVLVLLGRGWDAVVAPLQILAVGMLFRTSYKLSDSISRATGVVYARAWRQAIFVVAVATGAFFGQFWGVTGVAAGVVAAVATNFMLMAHLSLRVTGISWSEFIGAHAPAFALASVVGVCSWITVDQLRQVHVTPLILLLNVVIAAGVTGLVSCWLLPSLFLGRDGQSLLRLVAGLAPAWLRRSRPG